jgi:hypothetical protein
MIDKHYTVLVVFLNTELSVGRYQITVDLTGFPPDVYRLIAETDDYFCKGDLLIR